MKKLLLVLMALYFAAPVQAQQNASSKKYYAEERERLLQEIQRNKINKLHQKTNKETGEEDAMTHFRRWDYENRNHTMPDGSLANWQLLNLNEELKVQQWENQNEPNNLMSTNASWILRGPNQVNMVRTGWVAGIGRLNCMEWDAANNLYAGAPAGGLWKRTGTTWTCLTNSIPSLGVSGICFDPANNNNIFILTGDGDGGHSSSMGVLKTNDGGLSWQVTGFAFTTDQVQRGYKLIIHPVNSAIQFAVGSFGIVKTSDNWNTFTTVQSAQYPGETYFDIEFKSTAPATWYATSQFRIYKSTNTGTTWARINHSAFTPAPDTINIDRSAVEVSDAAGNQVFILHGGPTGFKGLYRSANSGASFTLQSSTPNILGNTTNGTDMNSQSWYDLAFEVDPTNSNNIYVAGIIVFRSTNAGISWDCIGNWSPNNAAISNVHADHHELRIKAGLLYSANDGGVLSRDPYNWPQGGWTELYQGLNITQFYKLGMDPTGALNRSYMGAQDNGMMLYDGDDNFELIRGGDGGDAIVDYTDHDKIFYIINGVVHQENSEPFTSCSSQNGYPWGCTRFPTTGCGCMDDPWDLNKIAGIGNRPLVYNPSDINNVYVGYTCIHESDNGGDNWQKVSCLDSASNIVTDFDFSTTHKWMSNAFFIFKETSPDVWVNATGDLTIGSGTIITSVVKKNSSLLAYAAFSGYDSTHKVFYTWNDGVNWASINEGLPNVPVHSLAYDNVNDILYAGTDIGVFYKTILGTWKPYRNGMPSVPVREIEISYVDNNLYAATFGRGLWRTPLVTGCPSSLSLTGSNVLPAFSLVESSGTIAFDAVYNNGTGQQTNLVAGNSVTFNVGAEVGNGSELTASIGSCSAPVAAPNTRSGYFANYDEVSKLKTAEKETSVDRLRIYPNPATDIINIEFILSATSPIEILVYDALGRSPFEPYLIMSANAGKNIIQMNIAEIPPGIYSIGIKTNGVQSQKKFVVANK